MSLFVSISYNPGALTTAIYVACGLVSYFLGAIPFGFLIVRWVRGVDIREQGSGNIGATNVGRVLGVKFFLLVLALDVVKGFGPAFGAWVVARFFPCPS